MKYLTLIFTFLTLVSWSQNDTINQRDADDKKTGYWKITGDMRNEPNVCDTCVIEEGNYIRNRKQGVWTRYNPNGEVNSQGKYNNGKGNGSYFINYENSSPKEIGIWNKGKRLEVIKLDSFGCVSKYQLYKNQIRLEETYKSDCELGTLYLPVNNIFNDSIMLKNLVAKQSFGTISSTYSDSIEPNIYKYNGFSRTKYSGPCYLPNDYKKRPTPLSKIKDKRIDAETHMGECYDSFNNIIQFGEFRDGHLYTGRQYNYDEFGY